jgi:hypothetical protein
MVILILRSHLFSRSWREPIVMVIFLGGSRSVCLQGFELFWAGVSIYLRMCGIIGSRRTLLNLLISAGLR